MTKLMATMLRAICGIGILITVAQADEPTSQHNLIGFTKTYFQQWSSSNAVALPYMDDVFPDQVMYFDKTLDHAALMTVKRRFADRWPERHFTERVDSLRGTCDTPHLCVVWGLVDWECRSPQRHEQASGTSVFSLQLRDGVAVVAEDGFVVSRGQALAWRPPEIVAKAPDQAKPPAPGTLALRQPTLAAQVNPPANHPGPYTNDDIPALRAAYFAESSDRDWVSNWLMAEKTFTGTARSLGLPGMQTLSGISGDDVHLMRFDTDHGPIACMIPSNVPAISKGSEVRIQGIVSIFIDQTMYLAHCSFT
ncbi:hypothetical protein [Rhodopila sp.]|uniref:hypothetical protein n=1 Tax=Rhodopila sp. TaxID=2480087 RepID=UPI003D0BC095